MLTMVLGDDKVFMNIEYNDYRSSVIKDFDELKNHYPFSILELLPTNIPEPAIVYATAVNAKLIKKMNAIKEDFQGNYSKNLTIVVPFNYRNVGCDVYGGSWIVPEKIEDNKSHFYKKDVNKEKQFKLCVGVPDSFVNLNNVLLENVRTAEHLLFYYEQIQRCGKEIPLKAYSHGEKGENEYKKDKRKFRNKF